MQIEVLLVIFVGVTALCLILQSLSVWQAARSANRILKRFEKRSEALERDAQQIMDQLQGLAQSLEPLRRVSENLNTRAAQVGHMFDQRTRDVDLMVQDLLQVGRRQASKVDAVVSDTVQKFEETTSVIQTDILRPVVEISSFLKGLKKGLDYLFVRKERSEPTS